MKNNYYDIKPILKTSSDYNIILGKRSNGKSYAVKYALLYEAYHKKDFISSLPLKRYKICYGRRWRDEIKRGDVESYFDDIPIEKITNGEYDTISVYNNLIYFAKIDENGKKIKGECIGDCFALTSSTHYKSLNFPLSRNYIFEEFISENAYYLPRDVENLESIIETIARNDRIRVFMIGNTINPYCPYFREWELKNATKQKEGTIDTYIKKKYIYDESIKDYKEISIKIAVEQASTSLSTSLMTFNRSSKPSGEMWEVKEVQKLPKKLDEYKIYYKLLIEDSDFRFYINLIGDNEKNILLYVYPCTNKETNVKRVVTDRLIISPFYTKKLTELTKYDKIVIDLLKNNKIAYSDNLTGLEFETIMKRGGLV